MASSIPGPGDTVLPRSLVVLPWWGPTGERQSVGARAQAVSTRVGEGGAERRTPGSALHLKVVRPLSPSSTLGLGSPRPPPRLCKPQHLGSLSLFAECQSSLTMSSNPCSAPLDLIGSAPMRAPHLDHPQTASVCTGAWSVWGLGTPAAGADNGWVKRVIFFSHLPIPLVCKSLSQVPQSRH